MNRNSDSDVRSDAVVSRDRLLAAAHEVLTARGEHAEVREMAARAGVAVGTLYRHFGDRGGLVSAVLEDSSRRTLERVSAAAAEPNARTALRAVIHVFADEYGRGGSLFALARQEQLPEDSSVTDDLRRIEEALVDLFEQGRLVSAFRPDLDARLASAMLIASLEVFAGPAQGRDPGAVADLLLDGICRQV